MQMEGIHSFCFVAEDQVCIHRTELLFGSVCTLRLNKVSVQCVFAVTVPLSHCAICYFPLYCLPELKTNKTALIYKQGIQAGRFLLSDIKKPGEPGFCIVSLNWFCID